MVGAAARGAKQSPRALIGQCSVIDVTSDSFQRDEKCLADSERACAPPEAKAGERKKKSIAAQRFVCRI